MWEVSSQEICDMLPALLCLPNGFSGGAGRSSGSCKGGFLADSESQPGPHFITDVIPEGMLGAAFGYSIGACIPVSQGFLMLINGQMSETGLHGCV